MIRKRCLPLATAGKGHDKHFPYSTESQADLGPKNCSCSYTPMFVRERRHLACLLTPEAQQKAGNKPEVKDYFFWSSSSSQNFLILRLYLHVLPCTFLKATSSHVHPICKHEYLLQMKGNLTEAGEGKDSISALHRSKDA